jgi:hypothetical protein
MKKKTKKKLELAKETVRELCPSAIEAAQGGNYPTVWYKCWGSAGCPREPTQQLTC